jgi:radical SAM superfamily enzyme YgiQ (UPF0313 family)
MEPALDLLLIDDEDYLFARENPDGKVYRVREDDVFPLDLGSCAARWLLEPPKLAVPLLAAQAKAAGHTVDSVYRPLLPWNVKRFRRLLAQNPRVVGITTVAMFGVRSLARLTDEVRRFSPRTVIVLGGHGAADSPAMRALGDLYISEHGERALADLITALKSGAALDQVPGVVVSPEGRRIMAGSLRYEGVPRVLYPDWGAASSGCRRYPVEASRGCRFSCSYCIFPGKGSQAFRDAVEVAGEMRNVWETRRIRRFEFVDSGLTSDPDFVLELCAALGRAKLPFKWSCFASAGCVKIFMGVESIHERILSGMRRGMGRETIEKGLSRVFKAGIKVHGNFIIGFPGETEATVLETADFIVRRPFTSVYLCTFGMSPEMRGLAAADPERYFHLSGSPIKGWRHDGMDYKTAYALTLRAVRKINWSKLWPVAISPVTNDPDNPPY